MSIFQIIATLFALFMMYTVTLYSKKRTLSRLESMAWLSVWSLFIIVALFPNLLLGISNSLRFARVFDLLVVAAFMVLSMLTFINYFRHKKLEDRIEHIVRTKALAEKD